MPEDVRVIQDPEADPDVKFGQVKRLLSRVSADCNVFEKVPGVDKVLDVCILSVDDSWRGMGIAKRLLDQTR